MSDEAELLASIVRNNRAARADANQQAARVASAILSDSPEILQQINKAFDAPTSYIALYDEGSQQITFPCYMNGGEIVHRAPTAVTDPSSLTAWVIRNDKPYATTDWQIADKDEARLKRILKTPVEELRRALGR